MTLNYVKRKNNKLFSDFETNEKLRIKNSQNYNPIYSKFFSLNENNYNSINLNHQWYISKILNKSYENDYEFSCETKNVSDENFKIKQKTFIKMAPLLEPYKYLVGKYNSENSELFNLPFSGKNESQKQVHEKIADSNNSSYVDSFFCYLSSKLLNSHKFINAIDFYGSFLGIKEKYKINVIDDIEYLVDSDFFNKNQNKLFQIEDYSHLVYKPQLKQIEILDDVEISVDTIENASQNLTIDEINLESDISLSIVAELTEIIDETTSENNLSEDNLKKINKQSLSTTTNSLSSECSSRSSHSSEDEFEDFSLSSDNSNTTSSSMIEEEMLFVTFEEFPVQLICLECCENTLDSLILDDEINHEEIFSALMQIIMTLLVYQKAYSFTHNDLHTNNVMYVKTNKQFIYYVYNKKMYKVPTFGKIYKIIDFGRAIYKFNGQLICSDCFKNGNDASTQYNTEPYFNDKKPRLEPNYSFDLCRLACSMFDYFIDDITEVDLEQLEPLPKLIFEWCLDDRGINILYKNTGVERYPDFKLYKMIARLVHNHIPEAQLERDEFKKYLVKKLPKDILKNELIINIDEIPSYSNI